VPKIPNNMIEIGEELDETYYLRYFDVTEYPTGINGRDSTLKKIKATAAMLGLSALSYVG